MRRRATTLLVSAGWILVLTLVGAATVFGASPTPGQGGDPRSPGQGPGLVGDPATAVLAVLVLAALSIVATTAWIRYTDRRGGRSSRRDR
jgi:hypothetical protein